MVAVFFNAQQLSQLAKSLSGGGYGHYLLDILNRIRPIPRSKAKPTQ